MVSTTDFFFPNCDDPYLMGKIACANVLSDLYSFAIPDCDNMLMLLAASTDMTPEQRKWSTKRMMQGFNDHCKLAGTKVTGGQTVKNPWPIIGGAASTVLKKTDFIEPTHAQIGDVLVLTKPLGTQVCANANQWVQDFPEKYAKIQGLVSKEKVTELWEYAVNSMIRLNRTGAQLMLKYKAHACTDVTGFGLAGHSNNLAQNQLIPCRFEIHTLPIISKMLDIDRELGNNWNLGKGLSAETSGGLLVALPPDAVDDFIREIQEIDHQPAWIVGRVVDPLQPGISTVKDNRSYLVENPTYISVEPNTNFNFNV